MSRFQRNRDAGEEQRATTLELFYDLVFVFAITQVSHLLLDDLSWTGAGKATLCLLVVWWAWNYTTWVTNELDPDSPVVRLVLLAIMLASLVMAVAIPEAFGSRGLLFAGAYVAIQVGRHAFLTFAAASRGSPERRRAGHILFWLVAGGRVLAQRRPRPRRAAYRTSGSSRSRSTTPGRSSSTGCRAGDGSAAGPGRWRPRTSPSASSCS